MKSCWKPVPEVRPTPKLLISRFDDILDTWEANVMDEGSQLPPLNPQPDVCHVLPLYLTAMTALLRNRCLIYSPDRLVSLSLRTRL
jgi:hypothetical protein